MDRETAVGKTVRDLEYTLDWQVRRQGDLSTLVERSKANQEEVQEFDGLAAQIEQTTAALALARAQAGALLADADLAIQMAESDLAQAHADLDQMQAGSADSLALAKAQDAVSTANLALRRAEESEAKITAGPDAEERSKAEAAVVDKQRALEEAQAAMRRARLVSPFAGVIAALPAQIGEMISSRTVVAELDDLQTMAAVANVDETEITKLHQGLVVQVTLDAFPGETFKGTLGAIPLQGKLQNDVLSFEVPVTFDYGNLALKPGMSVVLSIELSRANNALRVPTAALISDASGVSVQVTSPVSKRVSVKTGISNGLYTEILSGLRVGDLVIIPLNQSSSTSGRSGVGVMLP
jgi:HlyD family secretion protein